MPKDKLFTPGSIGPLRLRNRSIRSAAFEGMCPGGVPSDSLVRYHASVAAGGIGMTTVAYVSVTDGGRTFRHQAWMRPEIIPFFKKLTDAVHRRGAAASIQLGHGGNMADRKVSGRRAVAPSARFNLYGLTLPRAMSEADIEDIARAYADSVKLAARAGFDAVEIHAGHGYLISQFLSPYTNRRRDRWGGSFENRTRFLRTVMAYARKASGKQTALLVKTNLEDGFPGGMGSEDGIEVARILQNEGADALVLSGGFVSKTPLYMLRGLTPHQELISCQTDPLIKLGMAAFSRIMIRDYPYTEAYFLEEALKVRKAVALPLVYVGGLASKKKIDEVLDAGFDFIAMARSLIAEPDFINLIRKNDNHVSQCLACGPCNSCVATMYMGECRCTFEG
ncbi:MAG: NADH:flavin oxidoreductase [Spirochaetes bacterium RBG_16_49_21]|nr:MAG: NADH:flavin oxidoreductase [Spirochaetes bacterium RBG_16_49_21]